MNTGNRFKKGDLVAFQVHIIERPNYIDFSDPCVPMSLKTKTVARRVLKLSGDRAIIVRFQNKLVTMDTNTVRLV